MLISAELVQNPSLFPNTVNPHIIPMSTMVVKAQSAIGNSPSGLLSEKGIKIMKNKEKILNAFKKVYKNFRCTK